MKAASIILKGNLLTIKRNIELDIFATLKDKQMLRPIYPGKQQDKTIMFLLKTKLKAVVLNLLKQEIMRKLSIQLTKKEKLKFNHILGTLKTDLEI